MKQCHDNLFILIAIHFDGTNTFTLKICTQEEREARELTEQGKSWGRVWEEHG